MAPLEEMDIDASVDALGDHTPPVTVVEVRDLTSRFRDALDALHDFR
eukprot:gene34536-43770_t